MEIATIMLQDSGSYLKLMKNIDIFVSVVNWPDYFQATSSNLLSMDCGPNAISGFKPIVIQICAMRVSPSLRPGRISIHVSKSCIYRLGWGSFMCKSWSLRVSK